VGHLGIEGAERRAGEDQTVEVGSESVVDGEALDGHAETLPTPPRSAPGCALDPSGGVGTMAQMTSPNPDEDPQARLIPLREEAEAVARRLREDAASADERGDGHHHPAEAATDADARERELQSQLRWERGREQIRLAEEAMAAGKYGICLDCGQPISEGRLRA